jgi:hypothetical protein
MGHDVVSIDEAERAFGERRIVGLELGSAGARTAERVDRGRRHAEFRLRARRGIDRQRAAETMAGEEQRLLGGRTRLNDRFHCRPYGSHGCVKAFVKDIGLGKANGEIRDPILNFQRVRAGECDDCRIAPAGSDKTRTLRRQTRDRIVHGESAFDHAQLLDDIFDLGLACGLIGKLRHPHHGSGIVQAEIGAAGELVEGVRRIGTRQDFDKKAHGTVLPDLNVGCAGPTTIGVRNPD